METRPYRGEIDYERLAQYFRALNVPARLRLLHKLQVPRTSSEIELPPFRKDRDLSPERVLSRQAVEGHLEKLRDVGLVRARAAQREGQPAKEYLVNPARLFVLVDELRRIAHLQPWPSAAGEWTQTSANTGTQGGRAPRVLVPDGPCLVLVSGPAEGSVFALGGRGPWTIGRADALPVQVPYDPYVSGENSEIWSEGGRFLLRDLPQSSNGTTVNWSLLDKGEAVPLRSGDTIGVGRSLLVARGL